MVNQVDQVVVLVEVQHQLLVEQEIHLQYLLLKEITVDLEIKVHLIMVKVEVVVQEMQQIMYKTQQLQQVEMVDQDHM